jgi:hemin uptake protein HemP
VAPGEGARPPLPLEEGWGEGRRATRCITSDELFPGGAVELHIDHRGVLYRLKQTALGKLILTK